MGGIERRAKVPMVSEWNTSNYSRVRIATEKIIIYILPSQMAISPSTCGFFSAGVPYRPQSDMYTQCGFTNREANRAPKRYCIWNRIDPNTEIAQTLLVGRKRECKVFWCVYLFLLRFFYLVFFVSFVPAKVVWLLSATFAADDFVLHVQTFLFDMGECLKCIQWNWFGVISIIWSFKGSMMWR